MPFNVEAPMDLTFEPTRYPTPDWTGEAEVREAWIIGEDPVGWLVIQDNAALSWLSSVGPDRPGAYAVRGLVEDTISAAVVDRATAREAWNRVTAVALFREPQVVQLPDLMERLQEEWA